MSALQIQLLMLQYIKQHPDAPENEILENITVTLDSPEDKKLVNVKLIEGLFYGGLITVKMSADLNTRTYRAVVVNALSPSNCCKAEVYYAAEHDNFYCTECKKGQGNGFYHKHLQFREVK